MLVIVANLKLYSPVTLPFHMVVITFLLTVASSCQNALSGSDASLKYSATICAFSDVCVNSTLIKV
ncbi:MAG: hypothetical protein BWY47_01555 [Bacteroidetes bacterium ADurb.Bin302]|nr:MAG: hypothetical protein BWY47_01555 [Bacteroidetes bacterium ADurb.Bin302]